MSICKDQPQLGYDTSSITKIVADVQRSLLPLSSGFKQSMKHC